MNEETAQQAIEAYISAFNGADMIALGRLLAEDASITDWEISASGREAMLAATKKIVSGARVSLTLRGLIVELPFAAADLCVRVDDEVELEVLDLFRFGADGLIKSVRAFKGPERKL